MSTYGTILVGTDGSESSFRAVERAAQVAADSGANLLIASAYAQMNASAANVVQAYYDEILRTQPHADLLQQMSYVELQNRLPELLLIT